MLTRYGRSRVAWIDLIGPTPEEVRTLMQEFGIEPGVAEELLLPSFKSKVERHGDMIYAIFHFPTLHQSGTRSQKEIDFIIGKNFLITAHYETLDPLHSFSKAFEVESVLGHEHAHIHGGHLFVSILQSLYKSVGSECDYIHEKLEDIEEQIFHGDEKRMVIALSHIGRAIHDFRQALHPHREMLSSFEGPASRMFGPEFGHHMHATQNAYLRAERTLENLRDSLFELRETNNSLLSTKQNEVMKTLTVLAFLFLPLSFIGTVFGMNTKNNPIIGHYFDFWIIIGIMTVLVGIFFLYFKQKDWL